MLKGLFTAHAGGLYKILDVVDSYDNKGTTVYVVNVLDMFTNEKLQDTLAIIETSVYENLAKAASVVKNTIKSNEDVIRMDLENARKVYEERKNGVALMEEHLRILDNLIGE